MSKLKNFPEVSEEPKDLGIKIGTPEQAFWADMKTKAEGEILNHMRGIQISEAIIVLAKARIAEEKEKFK